MLQVPVCNVNLSRVVAWEALRAQAKDAVPVLLPLRKHERQGVRMAVAQAIEKIAPEVPKK